MKLITSFLLRMRFLKELSLETRPRRGRVSAAIYVGAALLAVVLSGTSFSQRVATSSDNTTLADKFETIENWVNGHDPAFSDPSATIQLKSQNILGLAGTAKIQLEAVSAAIRVLMEQRDWGLPAVAIPKTLAAIKGELCDSVLWVGPLETSTGLSAWFQRGSRNLSLGEDMWCNPGGGTDPDPRP